MASVPRSDIEGLRAVAIGAVLLYHARVDVFDGGYVGVDVFFVLSGFLITGTMLREVDDTGRLSLSNFWARRARRLLPASLLALVAAAVVTLIWLPITQRADFGRDIAASAVYAVNWRLSARSVDYLAEDIGASPVQHFWSLAVEEQFYIVWPIAIVAVVILVRRSRLTLRPAIVAVISTATLASFAWSLQTTTSEPASAYFSSLTRFWEIGIGALLALGASRFADWSDRSLAMLGWIGLTAIGAATIAFSTTTPWPSWRALVPTVGSALVIISGLRRTPNSPYALLSRPLAVWLGGLSYSLYLWHWPLLVGADAAFGGLDAMGGLAVVTFSFVPAWLAHRFVENPLRFAAAVRPSRRSLAMGAACAATSLGVGLALVATVRVSEPSEAGSAAGAAALRSSPEIDWVTVDRIDVIVPDPLAATSDIPDAYKGGCQVGDKSSVPGLCIYGDDDAKTLMLVGDSKAVQWESALRDITEEAGWQLVVIGKSGCAFSDADQVRRGERFTTCREWNDAVIELIRDEPPDLLVVSNIVRAGIEPGAELSPQSNAAMTNGYASRWRELTAAGVPLVVILDNPNPRADVYECVAENRSTLSNCSFDRDDAITLSGAPGQRIAAASDGVDIDVIDLTDSICPTDCPAVIGNVLVYRQDSHLTRTYVDSLRPLLAERLADITDGELGTKG